MMVLQANFHVIWLHKEEYKYEKLQGGKLDVCLERKKKNFLFCLALCEYIQCIQDQEYRVISRCLSTL